MLLVNIGEIIYFHRSKGGLFLWWEKALRILAVQGLVQMHFMASTKTLGQNAVMLNRAEFYPKCTYHTYIS